MDPPLLLLRTKAANSLLRHYNQELRTKIRSPSSTREPSLRFKGSARRRFLSIFVQSLPKLASVALTTHCRSKTTASNQPAPRTVPRQHPSEAPMRSARGPKQRLTGLNTAMMHSRSWSATTQTLRVLRASGPMMGKTMTILTVLLSQ